MKFSYVVLYVDDMEKSVSFYRDLLGMECSLRYTATEGKDEVETAFMVTPGAKPMTEQPMIELVCGMSNMPTVQSGELFGFTVDDVEETKRKLEEAGYPCIKGPHIPAEGITIYEFRGPQGERVGVMEDKTSDYIRYV